MGKTNRTPEFLAKFPLGKVPAFEGADGTLLTESDAIAQYVAESGPAAAQLLGESVLRRAQIRKWISFAQGEVFDPVTMLVLWRVGLRAYDDATERTSLEKLERSLKVLEKHLANASWLVAGDRLSLADITMAAALYWGFSMSIDSEMRAKYPAVVAWYERTVDSEGVKQAFGPKNFIDKRKVYEC